MPLVINPHPMFLVPSKNEVHGALKFLQLPQSTWDSLKRRNWSSLGSHLSILRRGRWQYDPQSMCVARVAMQHTQSPRAALHVPPPSLPGAHTGLHGHKRKVGIQNGSLESQAVLQWGLLEGLWGAAVVCWGCQRVWGLKKESLQLKKAGRSKLVFTGPAGVQGLFLAASLPRTHCPQVPWPTGHCFTPALRRKMKTHLYFWKPPLSSSPSSLTFLPPLSSCCTAQRREAQLPQLWMLLPGHFTALPGHHQSQRRTPELSLLSFPFSLLAAIYCSAVFGGGMQPVPGKGCCCQDSAG